MAEAAQAQAGPAMSPPTGIKAEPNPLEGFDFSIPSDTASKRPHDASGAANDNPDAKRLKSENNPQEHEDYGDEMNLIFQNAISNITSIMGQFGDSHGGDAHHTDDNHDTSMLVPTTEPGTGDTAQPSSLDEHHPQSLTLADDPTAFVRNANIHTLGNIAISMLLLLSQDVSDDPAARIRDPTSEQRFRFRQLHTMLEASRKLYPGDSAIFPDGLELDSPHIHTIIQFCNLALMGSWILEGGAESVREADQHLPAVFRDEILGLPRRIVNMLTDLKTHKVIHALTVRGVSSLPEEDMAAIFSADYESKLSEHNIANQIIGTEDTITDRLMLRMNEIKSSAPDTNWTKKYPWDDLVKNFTRYVRNQVALATDLGKTLGITMPESDHSAEVVEEHVDHAAAGDDAQPMELDPMASFFEQTASGLVEDALASLDSNALVDMTQNGEHTTAENTDGSQKPEDSAKPNGAITDYNELEALVAASTSNYVKTTLQGLSPAPYQPTVPASTAESMASHGNYLHATNGAPKNSYYTSFAQPAPEMQPHQHQHQQHQHQPSLPQQHQPQQQQGQATGHNLPPNQSCSSALLYEKARQAALSRQTVHTRREGTHSTRRPWTQEEEKALMTGLDMVKGPHWSQILGLFGPHGTISDILKDRTQVQLKDKARNLKLFFLKTNSEMPFYLNTVTGELKTRAPSQAARKEAEERARLNSEDDQSKTQGIMSLPGGLQHHASGQVGNKPLGATVGAVGPGVVTPAQAAAQAQAGPSGLNRTPGQASAIASSAPSTPATPGTNHNLAHLMPQQTPRPQAQQQQFHQQGYQSTPSAQQQPQQQNQQQQNQQQQQSQYASSSTPTPIMTPSHTPAALPVTPSQTHQSIPPSQSSPQTPAPPPTADHSTSNAQPDFTGPVGGLDNETEAALIRDLQAAVAQVTST